MSEPYTPKLDRGPVTPRLDRGPVTPRLDRGPVTPRLDRGPVTSKLDRGPVTSKLDSNPVRPPDPALEMHGFIRDTMKQRDARKNAERSSPKVSQPVTSTFVSAPISTLNSEPPLGRRTVVRAQEGESSMAAAGAFYSMRTVVSGGADNGDIYLQGGAVSGGTGNEIVDEILLYDASATSWEGTAGQHIQLEVTGSGQETSGILDPVFNVSGTAVTIVTTMDPNTLPESGDLSPKYCYISLGVFTGSGFTPAGAGNLGVSFCWGGYSVNRF